MKRIQQTFQQIQNHPTLRGGGCGASKDKKTEKSQLATNQKIQLPEDFSEQLITNTEIIQQKALLINDQSNQSEVLISIQWFICMEEKFILMSCNQQLVTQYFDSIKDCFINLLSVINIYLRTAGMICLNILKIMSQLSKIIFYFYIQKDNDNRFIKEDEKQELLSKLIELETQMEIESSNIWLTGIEFEIQILKACIKNLPSDSKQGQELLITFIGSAANSIATMSLDDKLIDTLLEGASFIIDKYQTHNLKQLYQLYYSLDIIKWSIIQQLKKGGSVTYVIYQLSQSFKKYISNSSDWIIHYCWIKLIGDLLQYRPIIKIEDFKLVNQNPKLVWNKLIQEKVMNPLAFDKQNYAKLNLIYDSKNYLENMEQVSKVFKGIEELKKLQSFLTNSKNMEINIFQSYISQRNQVTQEINVEKQFILQCRNFLFHDKSVEYISDLTNIFQGQIAMIISSIPTLLEKLKDFPTLQSNQDRNMIELQIEYYLESIQSFINQSQSIVLLLTFNSQYIDYYLRKQNLIIEEFEKVLQQSEIEKKFIEKWRTNLLKLNSACKQRTDTLEKIINQQFQISGKLKNTEQILIDVKNLSSIQEEMKPMFGELNQIIDTTTKSIIFIPQVLKELQIFSKQLVEQLVVIRAYHNKVYEDSKILNSQFFQQLKLKNMTVRLVQVFQYSLANWEGNHVKSIEKKFENLKASNTPLAYLVQENSNFSFSHQILSLWGEYWQLQSDFWDRGLEYFKGLQNNQVQNVEGQNLMIEKVQKDLLITLDQTIQIFQNIQKPDLILRSQKSQINSAMPIQDSSEPQFETIQKRLLSLKQQLSSQEKSKKIVQDIDSICKILQNKPFFKTQLKFEYISLLENMKKQYSILEYGSQIQEEKQIQKIIQTEEIIPIVTQLSELIRKINSELHEICQMGKSIEEIIQGSQQTLLDTDSEEVYKLIVNNLQSLIQQKIEEFITQLQELIQLQESYNQDLELFHKFQDYNNFQNLDYQTENEHFQQFEQIQYEIYIEQVKIIFSKLKHLNEFKEKSFFSDIFQEIKDKWNNQGYKLREAIAVSCIFISSNINEAQIQNYCQDTLVKIWASEKDERVKKILKNKDLLLMQTKIFSSDLKSANEKLKLEIQSRFSELEKLEQELKQEGDPQKREKLQLILREEFKSFEEYVDNMNDMNSELKLQMEFLKTITKQLKKMEEKIDQLQATLNEVGLDLKFLRGKKYDQLLQIRKQQVLQNKNQIDLQSVYIDLRTIEKDVLTGQYLDESDLFVQDIQNDKGEVNEFLWGQKDLKKDVMLIHGCAGSGKSTAARKIEEFLWIIFNSTQKVENKVKLLPIYVSLPTIKEPEQNAVEQALQSEAYHFDSIQLREFKEAAGKNEFRLVLILDSYDEIKSKFISKNLYKSNRLKEVWNNPKVIFTTRTEILTSHHYPVWFYGGELSGLKEIQILRFNESQRKKYLQQFSS